LKKISKLFVTSLGCVFLCIAHAADLRFKNYDEANAAGFPISGSNVFIGVGSTNIFQGWKLHVSARPSSMDKIFEIVRPALQEHPVHFKYTTFYGLAKLLSQPTQRGKFITIYPNSLLHANQIAHAIDARFESAIATGRINPMVDFETIENDVQLGETGGLFTRYGEYKNGVCKIVKSHGFLPELDALDCIKSSIIPDSRNCPLPDFALGWLDWAENPFPGFNMTWERIAFWR
jgi:hypothetical protein